MIVYGTSNFKESEIFDYMLNYFSIIAQKREISLEETRLFLMLYLEFILRINGIDSSKFNTNINLAKKLVVEDVEAYLQYVEKQCQFDVYFLRDNLKLACHNNYVYSNAPKSKRMVAKMIRNQNAQSYFNHELTNSGHLFQHIVQLITNKGLYFDYLKEKQEKQSFLEALSCEHKSLSCERKSLIKAANKRLEDVDLLHPIEIEATMLSYRYMLELLNRLMERTKNLELKKFLFEMKCTVEDDKENKYLEYLAHHYTVSHVNRFVGNCDFDETDLPLASKVIMK